MPRKKSTKKAQSQSLYKIALSRGLVTGHTLKYTLNTLIKQHHFNVLPDSNYEAKYIKLEYRTKKSLTVIYTPIVVCATPAFKEKCQKREDVSVGLNEYVSYILDQIDIYEKQMDAKKSSDTPRDSND